MKGSERRGDLLHFLSGEGVPKVSSLYFATKRAINSIAASTACKTKAEGQKWGNHLLASV